jgi:hypothetical protein
MGTILASSNVDGTPTNMPILASSATLTSYALAENNYDLVEMEVTVYIVTSASSTLQDMTFNFLEGANSLETIVKKSRAAVDDFVLNLRFVAKVNKKTTLTVKVGAAAADANTQFTLKNYTVTGWG